MTLSIFVSPILLLSAQASLSSALSWDLWTGVSPQTPLFPLFSPFSLLAVTSRLRSHLVALWGPLLHLHAAALSVLLLFRPAALLVARPVAALPLMLMLEAIRVLKVCPHPALVSFPTLTVSPVVSGASDSCASTSSSHSASHSSATSLSSCSSAPHCGPGTGSASHSSAASLSGSSSASQRGSGAGCSDDGGTSTSSSRGCSNSMSHSSSDVSGGCGPASFTHTQGSSSGPCSLSTSVNSSTTDDGVSTANSPEAGSERGNKRLRVSSGTSLSASSQQTK